jgi:hypothetical protein
MTLADYADLDCAPLAPDMASSLVRLLESARRNLDTDREGAGASIAGPHR